MKTRPLFCGLDCAAGTRGLFDTDGPPRESDSLLPVVADSWRKLRGCDVYRFLGMATNRPTLAADIIRERPDLAEVVRETLAELAEEDRDR